MHLILWVLKGLLSVCLKLLTSKAQVTRFAASQLVMMQARTSLIFRKAFSRPGIAPQAAPARQPPRKARIQMSPAGTEAEGMPSAITRETSLIQTIGRAARNADGKVILYADTVTPSMRVAMDETAIGGEVNLVTKSTPSHRILNFTAGTGYTWISEKPQLNLGATWGQRFFNDKFGVMASASYQYAPGGSDNTEFEYVEKDSLGCRKQDHSRSNDQALG